MSVRIDEAGGDELAVAIDFMIAPGRPAIRVDRLAAGVPTLTSAVTRSFSTTMSTGPQGGAPVPSMIVAPRRTSP